MRIHTHIPYTLTHRPYTHTHIYTHTPTHIYTYLRQIEPIESMADNANKVKDDRAPRYTPLYNKLTAEFSNRIQEDKKLFQDHSTAQNSNRLQEEVSTNEGLVVELEMEARKEVVRKPLGKRSRERRRIRRRSRLRAFRGLI